MTSNNDKYKACDLYLCLSVVKIHQNSINSRSYGAFKSHVICSFLSVTDAIINWPSSFGFILKFSGVLFLFYLLPFSTLLCTVMIGCC